VNLRQKISSLPTISGGFYSHRPGSPLASIVLFFCLFRSASFFFDCPLVFFSAHLPGRPSLSIFFYKSTSSFFQPTPSRFRRTFPSPPFPFSKFFFYWRTVICTPILGPSAFVPGSFFPGDRPFLSSILGFCLAGFWISVDVGGPLLSIFFLRASDFCWRLPLRFRLFLPVLPFPFTIIRPIESFFSPPSFFGIFFFVNFPGDEFRLPQFPLFFLPLPPALVFVRLLFFKGVPFS